MDDPSIWKMDVSEINLMEMDLIECIYFKDKHIDVYRDKYGKFYTRVDGKITQRKLNAKEIVKWLCGMMEGDK